MNKFVLVLDCCYDCYKTEENWPIEISETKEELQKLFDVKAEEHFQYWNSFKLKNTWSSMCPEPLIVGGRSIGFDAFIGSRSGDNPEYSSVGPDGLYARKTPLIFTPEEWFEYYKNGGRFNG